MQRSFWQNNRIRKCIHSYRVMHREKKPETISVLDSSGRSRRRTLRLAEQRWNENLRGTIAKPPFSPPGWLFPVVWTLLYALMGIGAARVYLSPTSRIRNRGLNLFIAQLTMNFFWSPIYFNLQAFRAAFFWLLLLWVLVLWMIFTFRKVDSLSAKLQIPYLLWLTFAAYLNLGVWLLNR